MSAAAKHLRAARVLFDLLADASPANDHDATDCIAAFGQLVDAIHAGLAAVDASTARAVVQELELLKAGASRMGTAAVAAAAIERARRGATP